MPPLSFDEVRRLWLAAGGKNTLGILEAFAPPNAQPWLLAEMDASAVADLRFIGTDAGGRWDAPTGGTHRIGDLDPRAADPAFRWNPDWNLFAVRDSANDHRVLIDGNERAQELHYAVLDGAITKDEQIRIITGDLNPFIVFVGKAIAPLWR